MEYLFVTARDNNDEFELYLASSLNKLKCKCAQISDKDEINDVKMLSDKYNAGISVIKDKDMITDDTILIFCKPNVKIIDEFILNKLTILFEEKENVGMVGVMGIKEINKKTEMYSPDNKPVNGIIYKLQENDKGEHIQYTKNGFYENIVGVDDNIFAIKGNIFKSNPHIKFLEKINKGVGIDMAINIINSGYDVVVADILVLVKDKSNLSFNDIDNVISKYDMSYPVSIKNFVMKKTNIVDVSL